MPSYASDDFYPDEDQGTLANRLWRLTATAIKRELWDSSYGMGQHPHLWAEILDDTAVPGGPLAAIANRRAEVEAVETQIQIIRATKHNVPEWK